VERRPDLADDEVLPASAGRGCRRETNNSLGAVPSDAARPQPQLVGERRRARRLAACVVVDASVARGGRSGSGAGCSLLPPLAVTGRRGSLRPTLRGPRWTPCLATVLLSSTLGRSAPSRDPFAHPCRPRLVPRGAGSGRGARDTKATVRQSGACGARGGKGGGGVRGSGAGGANSVPGTRSTAHAASVSPCA